jgi:tRNA(Arg) A34 adenosine deaminase TadA
MRDWKKYVDQYEPSASFRDEVAAVRVCQLAATAAELGTYAVGAVLLDDKGEVLADGHNETFVDGFRSDLHAEMVVLTKFETGHQMAENPGTLTLISSLEPCPMCMARLIYSGIGSIRYICEDPHGGMVTRKSSLPPKLQEISRDLSQVWELAECSDELREAAFQILEQCREDVDRRIVEHGKGGSSGT